MDPNSVPKSWPQYLRDTYVPFPATGEAHQILPAVPPGGKVIIIGDPHGCIDELKLLIEKCHYNKELDKVVIVGDLVNKGPDSIGVVRYVQENNFISLKGNHDDFALSHLLNMSELPDLVWTSELTKEQQRYLEHLPITLSIPQFNTLVVHAGLVPGLPLDKQHLGTLYRIRNVIEVETENGITYFPSERDTEGQPWASLWKGPQHVVFGHDAKRKLQQYEHATGIDTGCCYGGELTAFILPSKEIVSVKAAKMYSKPSG